VNRAELDLALARVLAHALVADLRAEQPDKTTEKLPTCKQPEAA
jgi:hypothetical protein